MLGHKVLWDAEVQPIKNRRSRHFRKIDRTGEQGEPQSREIFSSPETPPSPGDTK